MQSHSCFSLLEGPHARSSAACLGDMVQLAWLRFSKVASLRQHQAATPRFVDPQTAGCVPL